MNLPISHIFSLRSDQSPSDEKALIFELDNGFRFILEVAHQNGGWIPIKIWHHPEVPFDIEHCPCCHEYITFQSTCHHFLDQRALHDVFQSLLQNKTFRLEALFEFSS